MQQEACIGEFWADAPMRQHNPFAKEFQDIHDSYRNLEKLIWGLQNDFHQFRERMERSSTWSKIWSWIWEERQWTIPCTVILLGALASGSWFIASLILQSRIDSAMQPLGQEIRNLSNKITSIEGEIKGYFAQQHIKESKNYAVEGKAESAVSAARDAASTLASAAEGRLPATPGYFVDTIEMINGVAHVSSSSELSKSLQDARLSLAQYRSALLVGTVTYSQKIDMLTHKLIMGNRSTITGGYFDASKVPGDFAVLAPGYKTGTGDECTFQGTIFSGGMETLDGIRWINVSFVGTRIRYNGGPLYLDHVTFIGCTFSAPDNDRGARFAEYAALLLPTLRIG
jgi:hypothetical protein